MMGGLNMFVLEVKDLNKTIKGKKILDNVNFHVNQGEIFGLLGPNGAGKTTLIRCITSIMKPQSGEIIICGKNVKADFKNAIANVGALIEMPALYPYMSGYDNLKFFAQISNVDKKRIDDVIKIVGMGDFIRKKVKEYSLGMKQRLGIGVALLNRPTVLILDEPTNGLDPQGISDMRDYLKKLSVSEGVSVIVSSHMLSEMNLMCDRFLIMNKGKVLKVISKNDPLYLTDKEVYRFDVSEKIKALNLLKEKYSAYIEQDTLFVNTERAQIPYIIRKLVLAEIDVFGVQFYGNPLEKYYFNAINGSEGK